MKSALRISLKAGERIYVNGAVLRADRKVTIEILNDVTFLLEQHVMKPESTTTPLRQLYFLVQTMLIEPASMDKARDMARTLLAALAKAVVNREILAGLASVATQLDEQRPFEALKGIRALFPLEAEILSRKVPSSDQGVHRINVANVMADTACK